MIMLLGAELCLPKFICANPNSRPLEGGSIWRQGRERGKMKSYGWAGIQYDWCLYKKRRLKHRGI